MKQADFDSVLKLSPRELEIFQLAGKGKTTKEMARALKLSVKTVETYNAHIREKTGLLDVWKVRHLATRFVIFCEQNKMELVEAPVVRSPRFQFEPVK